MSLPLYMDVHVPLAITRGLRRRGVDVLTSQQDGTTTLPDDKLLDRVGQLGRIIFTRDEDLLVEAAMRLRTATSFATVVFARQTADRCFHRQMYCRPRTGRQSCHA